MIVYYALRSKSQYGMPHIIRAVLKDTTVYFFVMAMCHTVLALFIIFAKVVTLPFTRTCAKLTLDRQTTIKLLPAT